MRKLEERMVEAVNSRKNFREGNTVVRVDSCGLSVLLHDNVIYQERGGKKFFTLSGWNTVTTRSRLNALGVGVSQKNFEPVFCGSVINTYKWYKL